MKRFLLIALITIMTFGFSSCISGQDFYDDYQKVYFDRVVCGQIIADDYVYDGTYSYHILGMIPGNIYWELYPYSWEVYLYNMDMVRLSLFNYVHRPIFFGHRYFHHMDFNSRHRPPMRPWFGNWRGRSSIGPGNRPEIRNNRQPVQNNRSFQPRIQPNTQRPSFKSNSPRMNGGQTRGSFGGGQRGGKR